MKDNRTIGERIGDLRANMGWSQKELAEKMGVTPSQVSRIESGKSQTISSDILVGLSNVFHVSVDYLLGLTTISDIKNHDISELGLSEVAVGQLVGKRINYKVLNLLLEHKDFPKLIELIKLYFDGTVRIGVMTRNELFDSAISRLVDLSVEKPEYREEIRKDINVIAAQKLGEHEVELERIRRIFMSILKDVRDRLIAQVQPSPAITKEAYAQMLSDAYAAADGQRPTIEEVAASTVVQLRQLLPLSNEAARKMQEVLIALGRESFD